MRILVAVKQVPSHSAILRVNADGNRLDDGGLAYEMNGPDAYALEAALQLRDRFGCEVIVLSAGPERVGRTIREALAKGATSGIHMLIPEQQFTDPFQLASMLAQAARSDQPDLVLTGLQSEDSCYGETAVILAELLGYAHATIITDIDLLPGAVHVKRELEDGWSQYVTLPTPALLSIQSSRVKPRLATLVGIRQAKEKKIRVLPSSELEVKGTAEQIVEHLYAPSRQVGAQVFTGDVRACARQLVEQLRHQARVL